MEKNSTQLTQSRYVSGGSTEVSSWALEWWERAALPLDDTDTTYVVESKVAGRLDLIAATFLGDTRLWWMIAQMNNILDPWAEVTEGRVLRMPTPGRAQTLLVGRLGGFESAREVPTDRLVPIV
jgi:hypothetical protein